MKIEKNINISRSKKRKSAVFFGVLLILAGVLFIVEALDVFSFDVLGLTPLRIFLAIVSLAMIGWCVFHCPSLIPVFLGTLYCSAEPAIASLIGREDPDILNNWLVMGVALMLSVGFALIFKRKKFLFSKENWNEDAGNKTFYIDSRDLGEYSYTDTIGNVNIYFSNKEEYKGGGTVSVSDVVGNVVFHVPAEWLADIRCNDHLGSFDCPEQSGNYDKTVRLVATDIVGNVVVEKE
ncbi:MAG: hypothetical protein KBS44_02380 [Clostridiales bacterium]|nr:hypothetical protein [Candidatus Coliplasma equi]